ncbi:polymer-forming cytoskeletal protein [Parablautia intestinalis]|uniref:polymer-forming cytoskeletal protein n=1 Tax=Parablautia intestinalis TaxID=2320100 RepID=UPI00256F0D44|nr:polymer-forming cytoskeletal protein [Parablautia intestinalis]
MGFFSDLKDDLSQAVNELLPEEGSEEVSGKAADEETAAVEEKKDVTEEISADASSDVPENTTPYMPAKETRYTPESAASVTVNDFAADLSQMLENVEDVKVPEDPEPVYEAPVVEKKEPVTMIEMSSKKPTDETSVLTESMIINGNIATEGALDVRGSIVGNVEALGKLNITGIIQGNSQAAEIFADGARVTGELRSQGSIKVGQSTVILGNIYANSAVIAGAVKGDIDVRGPVILDASAIVMGDIKSKSVQINNGAVIEGMCSQCYAEVNPSSFFEELKKMK